MSFGYLGDTSTKIKQVKKNQGVLSISDVYELEKLGHIGPKLELISSTASGTGASLEITSIKESEYSMHLLHIEDYLPENNNRNLHLRMMVSGTADTGTDYEYALQRQSASTGTENKSTGIEYIILAAGIANNSDRGLNGYIRIYNAGDSSVFTSTTSAFTHFNKDGNARSNFCSGFYRVNAVVDGFHFLTSSSDNHATGTFTLYGVKDLG